MRIASPKLDVRDLEVVMALAAAGSTVRAAADLHLTQSAVSRALVVAEEKLGATIFERSARGLVPTSAGRRLTIGAPRILAELAQLETEATATTAPMRMRVACECYTAYRWLPSALAELHRRDSKLEIHLALEHTRSPVPALLAGDLDVALLTTSKARRGLVERPLFSDEVVFLVAADHPLARKPALSPSDLGRYPLLTSSQTPKPEREQFMRAVFGRKRPPRLERIEMPLTEAIIDAARAGMGIAVMSEWIAGSYLAEGDLKALRLRGQPLRRPWRIAYPKNQEAAATRLAAALTPPFAAVAVAASPARATASRGGAR